MSQVTTIRSFPLDVIRTPAEKVRGLPGQGFVQVLRADDYASLRLNSPNGYAVLAVPGTVVPVDKGIYIQNYLQTAQGTSGGVGGGNGPATPRGVLLLQWHETRDTILPIGKLSELPMRLLGRRFVEDTTIELTIDGIADAMHIVRRLSFGYAPPATAGNGTVALYERLPGDTAFNNIIWAQFTSDDYETVELRTPIIAQPGHEIVLRVLSSGAPSEFGGAEIYGGTIAV